LGVKTIMNLVGPLSNPADASYQIIGVYDKALLRPVAEAARLLGVKRVMTMHSRDGMDEISPCTQTDIVEISEDGTVKEYIFDPKAEGFGAYDHNELKGGDANDNAKLAMELANGKGYPALEAATAINAGAALYISGRAKSIVEGAKQASAALASGAVAAKIEELRMAARIFAAADGGAYHG
jgi:anthranilate synthase/phosphoribosyltransferase